MRRLSVAEALLRDPTLIEDGVWPRACTWLTRLALEHAIDDHWGTHRPEIAEASRRAQLLVLRHTVDAEIGRQATELWHTLSRAAHHHAYELAPTVGELRRWHRGVVGVVRALEERAAARSPAARR